MGLRGVSDQLHCLLFRLRLSLTLSRLLFSFVLRATTSSNTQIFPQDSLSVPSFAKVICYFAKLRTTLGFTISFGCKCKDVNAELKWALSLRPSQSEPLESSLDHVVM